MTLVPDKVTALPLDEFAEGLSPRSASEFALLTWKERKIYIVDRKTLDLKEVVAMPEVITAGWGITANEAKPNGNGFYPLYVSDGTDTIFLLDGETFTVTSSFRVKDPVADAYVD